MELFIDIFQKSSQSVEQRGRCGHRRLRGSLLSGSHSDRWSPSAILLGWMMFHGLVRSQFSLSFSYRVRSPGSATERRMGPMAISISGFGRQGQALDRQRCLRLLGFINRDLFTLASSIWPRSGRLGSPGPSPASRWAWERSSSGTPESLPRLLT